MSEHTSPHNQAPVRTPDHIDGLPEVMQLEAIEKLRKEQSTRAEATLSPIDLIDPAKRAKIGEEFEQMIDDRLQAAGFKPDTEVYNAYRAQLRAYSIDNSPSMIWDEVRVDDNGNITSYKQDALGTLRGLQEKYKDETDTVEANTPEAQTIETPELNTQRQNVSRLRDELAKLAAKRQSKMFSRSKTIAAYEAKLSEYRNAVDALTLAELEAEKDPNKYRSEDELRMSAASKLIGEFKSLQEKSVEILQNTKVHKFIEIMTRGGKVSRALKGVALGATIGVGGALLVSTGVGMAGGLAVAGALAGRFARAYATADNKAGRGLKVIEANDETKAEAIDRSEAKDFSEREDIVEGINMYLLGTLHEDIAKEQSKRRKSAMMAVGMVAAGAVVGATAAHFIGEAVSASGTPDTVSAKPDDNIYDSEGSQDDTGGDSTETEPIEEKEYSAEALTMSSGEGFYSTFESLDIPQKDWPELLNKAGPELHDMQVDGHPLAYEMPNGQWGLNMTSDGTFPEEGLDKITSLHDEMTGEATSSSSVEDAQGSDATPETETAPADTDTEALPAPIESSEIQNVMDKSLINPSDIEGNAALTDLAHVAVWQSPDVIGEKLGLSLAQWENLQDHIAAETVNNNRFYTDVFRVSDTGYLHFKTPTIPAATMADMLNNIPLSERREL